MAYSVTRVALFGAIGLILAASIILAIQVLPLPAAPSVPEIPTAPASGILVLKVTDAPAKALQELYLLIDDAQVHKAGGDGGWLNLSVLTTEPFDLLTLNETDASLILAITALPVGNYTEIRLHVDNANATIDGVENQTLKVVANGWLKVKVHFTIETQELTSVTVDIQVNPTPIVNARILHPVVKADVTYTPMPESTIQPEPEVQPIIEQISYQWVADDARQDPTPLAAENTSINDVAITGAALRLRLALRNIGTAPWSAVQLKLQYSPNQTDWTDVGTSAWLYADGLGTDGNKISTCLLLGSTVKEHVVESSLTPQIVEIPVDGQGEWDICIESNGAGYGETYSFRFVLADGTFLDLYSEYPTLTTVTEPET